MAAETTADRLSARTVAIRSLSIGFCTMILAHLVAGPEDGIEFVWPAVLALWIAAGTGSFMMAWSRRGMQRWAWAGAGTVLLVVFVLIALLDIPDHLVVSSR